jgi:hypothetical protein
VHQLFSRLGEPHSTGLGLIFCKLAVELQAIGVESALGAGRRFVYPAGGTSRISHKRFDSMLAFATLRDPK